MAAEGLGNDNKLVLRRTCSGTGHDVGAPVSMAVERRASVLGRSAPSRSRGLSLGLEFRSRNKKNHAKVNPGQALHAPLSPMKPGLKIVDPERRT